MSLLQRVNLDHSERVIFVGDIHGMNSLLEAGLEVLNFRAEDTLVSVGDLIDRGEQNIEVLTSFIFADNRIGVMGNHDMFLVEALLGRGSYSDWAIWYQNGGYWAEDQDKLVLKGMARQLQQNFPLALLIEHKGTKVGVAHAEFPTLDILDLELEGFGNYKPYAQSLIWGRSAVSSGKPRVVKGVDLTVHGHTVTQLIHGDGTPTPLQLGNQHWIDTGSCFTGGRLTFAELIGGKLQYTQVWYEDGELQVL